jgi:hypothetical protein
VSALEIASDSISKFRCSREGDRSLRAANPDKRHALTSAGTWATEGAVRRNVLARLARAKRMDISLGDANVTGPVTADPRLSSYENDLPAVHDAARLANTRRKEVFTTEDVYPSAW